MTQITDKVFAYEMPENAENVRVSQLIGTPKLFANIPGFLWSIKLPPGTWRFLFTTKSATEEQARTVVEHDAFIDGYKDYDTDRFHHDTPFIKATDSLISLLQSKGLDPDKNNYAIIVELTPNGK